MLIKHETVMKRAEKQYDDRFVYFQSGDDEDEYKTREGYCLTRTNYDDMGQPDVVTLTVVPGNSLNQLTST
jgi:hypothetical protein